MNLTALQRRIEALEEKRGQEGVTDLTRYHGRQRKWCVVRIIDGGKVLSCELQDRLNGGRTVRKNFGGPITEEMLVLDRVIIDPIHAFDASGQKQ